MEAGVKNIKGFHVSRFHGGPSHHEVEAADVVVNFRLGHSVLMSFMKRGN